MPESEYNEKPLIYCHFVEGIGDPKYLNMPSWATLNKIVSDALAQYNELVAGMNLVMFEDAMSHVCRQVIFFLIKRIKYQTRIMKIFNISILSDMFLRKLKILFSQFKKLCV